MEDRICEKWGKNWLALAVVCVSLKMKTLNEHLINDKLIFHSKKRIKHRGAF